MDFINQAAGQLRELMLSMTPAARVTAALLLGIIVVSLGYLVQHQSASPDDYLFNGEVLPGTVLTRAEAAIAKKGLTGYEIVGNRIKVPRNRRSEFLAAVAEGGALPPNYHSIIEQALELGPFVSSDTRREKLKAAREQQLSMLISNMAGIEQATVMFDVSQASGLNRKGEATATVSVLPTPGETLDLRTVKSIRKAVAAGILELQPDNVVVTDSGDGSLLSGGEDITSESFDNEYYQVKLGYEKKMQRDIEYLLRDVPGVRVRVTAELESTLESTTQILTPEGEPVDVRRKTQDETDKISELDNGGQPGLNAQGPLRNKNENATVTVKNDRTKNSNETESVAGQRSEFTRAAALVPRGVRATIAIPTNYLTSVWQEGERNDGGDPTQPMPVDEKDAIEVSVRGAITNIVKQILPKELGQNPFSGVEVTFLQSLTPKAIAAPSAASKIFGWASQNFNTMTMAVVALVSLMMLRSMVKSIPHAEPTAAIASPTLALDTVEGDSEQTSSAAGEQEETQRPRLRLKKGDSLKDDLTEIVREDPDAAAAILRSWIGNAG